MNWDLNRGRNSGRVSSSRSNTGQNHTANNSGTCWRCGQHGYHQRDCRQQAQASLVESGHTRYGTFGEQESLEDIATLDIFMISAQSSIMFPFGDRKALI